MRISNNGDAIKAASVRYLWIIPGLHSGDEFLYSNQNGFGLKMKVWLSDNVGSDEEEEW